MPFKDNRYYYDHDFLATNDQIFIDPKDFDLKGNLQTFNYTSSLTFDADTNNISMKLTDIPMTISSINLTNNKHLSYFRQFNKDDIKLVNFNEYKGITTVKWADDTITQVKVQREKGDIFNPEVGLTMCIVKKVFGNKGNFNNVLNFWVDKYYSENVMADNKTVYSDNNIDKKEE